MHECDRLRYKPLTRITVPNGTAPQYDCRPRYRIMRRVVRNGLDYASDRQRDIRLQLNACDGINHVRSSRTNGRNEHGVARSSAVNRLLDGGRVVGVRRRCATSRYVNDFSHAGRPCSSGRVAPADG